MNDRAGLTEHSATSEEIAANEEVAPSQVPISPLPLSYATSLAVSLAESPSAAHYRAAVLCGTLPLFAGTTAFLGFVATRWELFAVVGILVVPVGVFLFVVGGCDLSAYAWEERQRLGGLRGDVRRRVLLAGLLLLVNFPIAVLYVSIANRLANGRWF